MLLTFTLMISLGKVITVPVSRNMALYSRKVLTAKTAMLLPWIKALMQLCILIILILLLVPQIQIDLIEGSDGKLVLDRFNLNAEEESAILFLF